MSATDYLQVAALEAGQSGGWTQGMLRAHLNQESSLHFSRVAVMDGSIAGYVIGRGVVDEMEIHRLVVAKKRRRQGIGRMLLRDLFSAVRTHGIHSCFLEVRSKNHTAQSFYKSEDFYRCGFRCRYYEKPEDDALVFRKDIAVSESGDAAEIIKMVMGL